MISELQTYNPGDAILEIAGFTLTDWDSIVVHRNTEAFTFIKGIRGVNTRAMSLDTSLTITVEVGSGSIVNDVFSEIIRQDLVYGSGQCYMNLTESSGSTQIRSDNAFIKDLADIQIARDAGTRKWEIICLDSYGVVMGGNVKSVLDLFGK